MSKKNRLRVVTNRRFRGVRVRVRVRRFGGVRRAVLSETDGTVVVLKNDNIHNPLFTQPCNEKQTGECF